MCHPFAGFSGIVVGVLLFLLTWLVVWRLTPHSKEPFNIDPPGEPGGFKEILAVYLQCAGIVVTLASGSVVFLVGSKAFDTGHLPWKFASPLFLLASTVVYALVFAVLMTMDYEHYKHQRDSYSEAKYVRNQALGFAGLECFVVGYVWLIVVVTR
jgi:hypothetical protein